MIKKEDVIKILKSYDMYDFEIEEDLSKEQVIYMAYCLREDLSDWEGDSWSVKYNERIVGCAEQLEKLARREL